MIASVRGVVLERDGESVVVETGGVGLRLAVSSETLKAVPVTGQSVFLLSEMLVRDDSITLYGFSGPEELELFRLLITVSGIGPRVAISALSAATPRQLAAAVVDGDADRFEAVPGIGRRTAERVIVELRGKVKGLVDPDEERYAPVRGKAVDLARAGLMGLGYDSAEAGELLSRVSGDSPEELIAAALREAGGEGAGR